MTHRTLIIAEAGVNHNGDLNFAKQLIDAAVDAGADLVKAMAAMSISPNSIWGFRKVHTKF